MQWRLEPVEGWLIYSIHPRFSLVTTNRRIDKVLPRVH